MGLAAPEHLKSPHRFGERSLPFPGYLLTRLNYSIRSYVPLSVDLVRLIVAPFLIG